MFSGLRISNPGMWHGNKSRRLNHREVKILIKRKSDLGGLDGLLGSPRNTNWPASLHNVRIGDNKIVAQDYAACHSATLPVLTYMHSHDEITKYFCNIGGAKYPAWGAMNPAVCPRVGRLRRGSIAAMQSDILGRQLNEQTDRNHSLEVLHNRREIAFGAMDVMSEVRQKCFYIEFIAASVLPLGKELDVAVQYGDLIESQRAKSEPGLVPISEEVLGPAIDSHPNRKGLGAEVTPQWWSLSPAASMGSVPRYHLG